MVYCFLKAINYYCLFQVSTELSALVVLIIFYWANTNKNGQNDYYVYSPIIFLWSKTTVGSGCFDNFFVGQMSIKMVKTTEAYNSVET